MRGRRASLWSRKNSTATVQHELKCNRHQLYENLSLPADTSQIRLLELTRSHGCDDPLRGTLRIVDLAARPQFTALSYVWGPYATPRDTITCNGVELEITRNCYQAIRALSSRQGDLTVWIDGICVDQENEREKVAQIQQMGQIFTWAHTTYIWFGPGSESTDKSIEALAKGGALRLRSAGIPWVNGETVSNPLRDRAKLCSDVTKLFWSYWTGRLGWRIQHIEADATDIENLLQTEWLVRAWTFQELVLAGNPVILCGQTAIDWAEFQRGLEFYWYRASSLFTIFSSPIKVAPAALEQWLTLFDIWLQVPRPASRHDLRNGDLGVISVKDYQNKLVKQNRVERHYVLAVRIALPTIGILIGFPMLGVASYYKQGLMLAAVASFVMLFFIHMFVMDKGHAAQLEHQKKEREQRVSARSVTGGLIQAIRSRESSEPRDRAHAVNGIMQRLGMVEPQKIDCEESLGQTYQRLYSSLLRHRPSTIALLVDAGLSSLDAPSWVPDWTSVRDRAWLPSSYIYDHVGDSEDNSVLQVTVDAHRLKIQAILRGTVTYFTGRLPVFNDDDVENMDALELSDLCCTAAKTLFEWFSVIKQNLRVTRFHGNIPLAMWDAISGIVEADSSDNPGRMRCTGCTFDQWFDQMHTDFPDIDSHPIGLHHLISVRSFLIEHKTVRDFVFHCCQLLGGRRGLFFSPDAGIGTACLGVEAGDQIAQVNGVAAGLVLREAAEASPKTFRLIGPSYTHDPHVRQFFAAATSAENCSQGRDKEWENITLV